MTRRLSLLSLVLLAVLASACGRYLTTGVAVVNGVMIPRDELDRQVASVYANPQFQGSLNPEDAEQRLQVERQVIVQLIQDELVRQEAERLNIDVTRAQIDARFQAIEAAQPQELAAEVQSRGLAAVRDLIEGQLLSEGLSAAAGKNVSATDAELRAAYGNGQRFEEIKVRHILFQVADNEAAVRAKAQSALDQLREGADFATLAKQLSEDPGSKEAGGDLGYITREVNFDETFLNAAFAVKEGRISGLVRTQFGYHIIKVDDRRSKTFEQARVELSEEIATQKRTQAFQDFLTERLRIANIVVNPRWGDFDKETFRIETHEFFVPPSPEPETQPVPLG
ncbi:MAG TPA: peptidylprolyl isomerase [Actinomycetota bacterium]|nr:peptidylprolyl isomerase [Actinomycetota bacterium]